MVMVKMNWLQTNSSAQKLACSALFFLMAFWAGSCRQRQSQSPEVAANKQNPCLDTSPGEVQEDIASATAVPDGLSLAPAPAPVGGYGVEKSRMQLKNKTYPAGFRTLEVTLNQAFTPEVYMWKICNSANSSQCYPTANISTTGWAKEYFSTFEVFPNEVLNGKSVSISVVACLEKDAALEVTNPEVGLGTDSIQGIGNYICTLPEIRVQTLARIPSSKAGKDFLMHLSAELRVRQVEVPKVITEIRAYARSVVAQTSTKGSYLSQVEQEGSTEQALLEMFQNIAKVRETEAVYYGLYGIPKTFEALEAAEDLGNRQAGLLLAGDPVVDKCRDDSTSEDSDLSQASGSGSDANNDLLSDPLSSISDGFPTSSSSDGGNDAATEVATASTTGNEPSQSDSEEQGSSEDSQDEEGTADLDDESFEELGESGEVSTGNLNKIFIGLGVVGIGMATYAVWDSSLFGQQRFSEVKRGASRKFWDSPAGKSAMGLFRKQEAEVIKKLQAQYDELDQARTSTDVAADGSKLSTVSEIDELGASFKKSVQVTELRLNNQTLRYHALSSGAENLEARRALEIAYIDHEIAVTESRTRGVQNEKALGELTDLRDAVVNNSKSLTDPDFLKDTKLSAERVKQIQTDTGKLTGLSADELNLGTHKSLTSSFKDTITSRNVDGEGAISASRFKKRYGIIGAVMGAIGVTVAVKSSNSQGASLKLTDGQGSNINSMMEKFGSQLYKVYTKREALNRLKYQAAQ